MAIKLLGRDESKLNTKMKVIETYRTEAQSFCAVPRSQRRAELLTLLTLELCKLSYGFLILYV